MFLKKPASISKVQRQGFAADTADGENLTWGEQTFVGTDGASLNVGVPLHESKFLAPISADLPRSSGATSFGSATLLVDDTADHIINAAEAAAVSFTVSGLEAGAAGTVIFSDASDHTVEVAVGGNGTFSANLCGLTDGRVTSLLTD